MRCFSMGSPSCNSKPDKLLTVYKCWKEFLLSSENWWEVTSRRPCLSVDLLDGFDLPTPSRRAV